MYARFGIVLAVIVGCSQATARATSNEASLQPQQPSRVTAIMPIHARKEAERWVRRGDDPGIGPYFLLLDDMGHGCLVTKTQSQGVQEDNMFACAWTRPRPAIGS